MNRFAFLTAAGLLAAPAYAGSLDAPVVEPVIQQQAAVAPVSTGGNWTGGYAGIQLGYGDVSASGNVLEGNGALGGVHAGYTYDFGKYVLGGEIDWDKTDTDLSNGTGTLDDVARLKLRAGADLGRTLIYGTAGAARANATVGGVGLSDAGYFGGIGVDYALTDRWTVGGEVLTHRFDDFDGTGIDINATTATARASFKF